MAPADAPPPRLATRRARRLAASRNVEQLLPISKHLLLVVWPFVVIVVVLVALASASMDILSAARAYVGGESLWSKAQKEAVQHLTRYARTQDEHDFARYRVSVSVPLGDRVAREELEKPDPDLARVREGFIAGRNDPSDIPGMIMLFRRFRHVSYIDDAIRIWETADRHIERLTQVADRLHEAVANDSRNGARIAGLLAEIDAVNANVTPLEDAFSRTLGEASRKAALGLELATLVAALALIACGVLLARRMRVRGAALESALLHSEERYNLAVAGSNDGLWDWDIATNTFYFSPRCRELVGLDGYDAAGSSESLFQLVHPDDRKPTLAAVRAHLRDDTVFDVDLRCRLPAGDYRWFRVRGRSVRAATGDAVRMAGSVTDITDRKHAESQLHTEKERAQVTLASIADSVITTDIAGNVDYLNLMAEALTGWTTAEARGRPLQSVCALVQAPTRSVVDPVGAILAGKPPDAVSDVVLIARDGTEIAVNESAAPIRDRQGTLIGVVLALHDVRIEREFASQLSYQASHDALTGLINRREFEHRLALALASVREQRRHHAMLYLDLDQFKIVNDTCGHATGDELMRQISVALASKLREGDTLARLGGDEFGVLLENCPVEHAIRIAEKLRETVVDYPFVTHNRRFAVSVSVGLVNIADPTLTLADVLSAGDTACYMAKENGRNRVQVFHPRDSELAVRHGEMEWVARLQSALAASRFVLHAQEIVPVAAPHAAAERMCELLVRMVDERGELIAPRTFIPAAERYDLMPTIDRWVLRNALATIGELDRDPAGAQHNIYIINLSGASIGDDRFLDFARGALDDAGVACRSICFEITETAAIANIARAAAFINELKALGCRFSLDDFGVGMASFGHLKHLPVDFIKIDGSFVRDMLTDPIDNAFVEAINRIGHVMGKRTIAECVETAPLIARVYALGVDYAQGFAIAMPRPFDVHWHRAAAERPLKAAAS